MGAHNTYLRSWSHSDPPSTFYRWEMTLAFPPKYSQDGCTCTWPVGFLWWCGRACLLLVRSRLKRYRSRKGWRLKVNIWNTYCSPHNKYELKCKNRSMRSFIHILWINFAKKSLWSSFWKKLHLLGKITPTWVVMFVPLPPRLQTT